MKYLITLLFLLSTLAFGIDKKTPTGGTVKDKPGKSQESGIGFYLQANGSKTMVTNYGYDVAATIKVPKGTWMPLATAYAAAADAGSTFTLILSTSASTESLPWPWFIETGVVSATGLGTRGQAHLMPKPFTINSETTYYLAYRTNSGGGSIIWDYTFLKLAP